MKANGRRRWRKWAKKQRQRYASKCMRVAHSAKAALAMRRARKTNGDGPMQKLPPLLAESFSVRSLVGMSEASKKRKARCATVTHAFREPVKLVWFKCWARDVHRRIMTAEDERTWKRYEEARARYRIGQRLRPCPGCERCKPGSDDVHLVGRRGDGPWIAICDGSGLVPSRRARRNP